jgi:hypothetical protein
MDAKVKDVTQRTGSESKKLRQKNFERTTWFFSLAWKLSLSAVNR